MKEYLIHPETAMEDSSVSVTAPEYVAEAVECNFCTYSSEELSSDVSVTAPGVVETAPETTEAPTEDPPLPGSPTPTVEGNSAPRWTTKTNK